MTLEPKPLIQIISEEEFLILVQEASIGFFKAFNAFKEWPRHRGEITRKFYSNLIQEAELFESFLDEHGARENKTWARFTEYVASIRNLVKAGFFIRHLVDRYPFYHLRDSDEMKSRFFSDASEALAFIDRSVLNLYEECIDEARKNHLVVLPDSIDPEEFSEIEVNKRLPKNTKDEEVLDQEDRIIDLLEKMNTVARLMEDLNVVPTRDVGELKRLVPNRIDEKSTRNLMNLVHSIQSEFDTYIKSTPIEQKHESLKHLRGYISVPLHLLEAMIWLIHFYERHEDEIRKGEAKLVISSRVNKAELLSHIVNFCYFYSLCYVREGLKLSNEILATFVKTVRYELPVPDPLGFHARPSTYVSLIVRRYDADAWLIVDGEKYDARSVMSLLQAGGVLADKGYRTAVFEGDKRILDDLKILAEHNYCEETGIPDQLAYLRTERNSQET